MINYMAVSKICQRHAEHNCDDSVAHIAKFLVHDHGRLTLSFFARQVHYKFDLSSSKTNIDAAGEREVGSGSRADGTGLSWVGRAVAYV